MINQLYAEADRHPFLRQITNLPLPFEFSSIHLLRIRFCYSVHLVRTCPASNITTRPTAVWSGGNQTDTSKCANGTQVSTSLHSRVRVASKIIAIKRRRWRLELRFEISSRCRPICPEGSSSVSCKTSIGAVFGPQVISVVLTNLVLTNVRITSGIAPSVFVQDTVGLCPFTDCDYYPEKGANQEKISETVKCNNKSAWEKCPEEWISD